MAALTYSISATEAQRFTSNVVLLSAYTVSCSKSLSVGADPLVSPNLIQPALSFSQA